MFNGILFMTSKSPLVKELPLMLNLAKQSQKQLEIMNDYGTAWQKHLVQN
jgi:hypothetical protein